MKTFLRELEALKKDRGGRTDEEYDLYVSMLDNLVVKLRRGDYHNSGAMVHYLMASGVPSEFAKRVGDGEFAVELAEAGCFPPM